MLADLSSTTTFFDGNYTTTSVTITICCALALCNAIEILIWVFTTFKRFRGLYFYSLVIASSGIVPYVVGFVCAYFRLANQHVGITISTVGWPMMGERRLAWLDRLIAELWKRTGVREFRGTSADPFILS